MQRPGEKCFALPPVGPGPRVEATKAVLQWLKETRGAADPTIERADLRLADEIQGSGLFKIEAARDHFDYVYRSEDLIKLSGNRYHGKKNHINKFRKTYEFSYEPLTPERVKPAWRYPDLWCKAKRCHEDIDLMDEAMAVKDILQNLEALKVRGGVLLINDKVEAFTLGEMLNPETAVVHIEKANPEIPQAFVVINQQFCEHTWQNVRFINREQDLGDEGLRKAKLSYHPVRLVEKFKISLA